MDMTLINLTFLKVNGEIENFSGNIYPRTTYQKILRNPPLRQKLVAYILGRIPNRYAALHSEKLISISPEPLSFSKGEKIELKQLVQQGVVYLILSEINKNASLNQQNAV